MRIYVPMRLFRGVLSWTGTLLLWTLIAACLAAAVIPRYLDRIYYHGPESGHYDGERFFNPDGDDAFRPPSGGSRAGFFFRFFRRDETRPVWPAAVSVA